MRIDWLVPGELAGSGRPGLLESLDKDIDQLQRFGFTMLVNLTEVAPDPALEEAGLHVEHFPIPDMGVPTPRAMQDFCNRVFEHVERGQKALVHCRAGLGRTGTFLACYLVHGGEEAERAIVSVRLVNPRFIQSQVQERFVGHYADFRASEQA